MSAGAVLCVYYKVDSARHQALAPRARQWQAQLSAQWPGLVCELLQRPEACDGVETWMETYRHPAGLTRAMIDAIAAAAEAAPGSDLPAPRHAEHFIALR